MDYNEIQGYKDTTKWYARGDHFYVAGRTRPAGVYMRCATEFCEARWSIGRNGIASAVRGIHNHEPTPWIPNRNAMFQALKQRAHEETLNLNQIYEEEAARYPDAASHLLYESVAPSMRRWRREVVPPVPHTLQAYAVALSEHPRHSQLLLATVSAGGGTAVILIAENFAQCLRDSDVVIADGTFLTVPAGLPAYQILTLHGVIAGNFYHPVLVLMSNRQRILYESALQRIWQAAGYPHPRYVVTDFEPALQAALGSVTGVQVSGCLFHYVQALMRRAKQLGIRVNRRDSPGWLLVQLYGALAWLPPDQVRLGLAEVPSLAQQHQLPFLERFHQYVENFWVFQITPERFSVAGRPHRTSNVAESYHASLRRALGPSPNIWRFTEVIAQKFNVSEARRSAQDRGRVPRRNKARQYLQQDTGRAAREEDFRRGRTTLREYLWLTAQNANVAVAEIGAVPPQDGVPQVGAEVEIGAEDLELEVEFPEAIIEGPPLPQRARAFEAFEVPLLAPEPQPHPPLEAPAPQPQPPQPVLCPICMENMPTEVLVPCGHVLCANCHGRIIGTCPTCRAPIASSLRFYLP